MYFYLEKVNYENNIWKNAIYITLIILILHLIYNLYYDNYYNKEKKNNK